MQSTRLRFKLYPPSLMLRQAAQCLVHVPADALTVYVQTV